MAFSNEFTSQSPLLLIGAGNMGGALLQGWLKAGLEKNAVIVVDPRADELLKNPDFKNIRLHEDFDKLKTSIAPRVTVFAVKPQFMKDVFQASKGVALERSLLLSIAAGTQIKNFAKAYGKKARIIRAMPNTPAAIGRGITAMVGTPNTKEDDLKLAEDLLSCVGRVCRVDEEDLINAVTAVSGSGPAYFFYLVECLADAARAVGLKEDLANDLARQTFVGAAALLEASGEEAASLRKKVTSPKGTTEAALEVLMDEKGLKDLIKRAVIKARDRGRALSD